jgi:hypothetical protein
MHKRQEAKNVKTCYEFFYDPTKVIRFECKTRIKVDHRMMIMKLCKIVFFLNKLWFFIEHFCHEFSRFGLTHILFFFRCVLHSLKVLHNKWYSHHYVCIMWKELLKDLMNQKRKDVIISLMFFIYIYILFYFILAKKLVWYMFW